MKLLTKMITISLSLLLSGCTTAPAPAATPTPALAPQITLNLPATPQPTEPVCRATRPFELPPSYKAGAVQRSSVGGSHILSGVVRSEETCAPVADARLELWLVDKDKIYTDALRAVIVTGADGKFRFESPFPPTADGIGPHIFIKVTAPGFADLVTAVVLRDLNEDKTDLVIQPTQ